MDKLYIVIPAYNEAGNIKPVVNEWYEIVKKIGPESRLVVIDDGSKDDTYQILTQLAKTRPQLEVKTKANSGHGGTILYGYQYSLDQGADYIFQTDSDGQTLASEFMPFWKRRHDFDAQFGFRKKRGDGLSRWIVTKVLRLVVLAQFHVWITDVNSPYRLMSAQSLAPFIKKIPQSYNLTNVLISVLYAKNKKHCHFREITFRPRQGGKNSINLRSISKIGVIALHDFSKLNQQIKTK